MKLLGIPFLLLLLLNAPHTHAEVSEGERLARIHCATCHSFPEPDILPKRSWQYLLVYMGYRMGVEDLSPLKDEGEEVRKAIKSRKKLVQQLGVAPAEPMVTKEHWDAIRDYILEAAPEVSLPQQEKPELQVGLDLFQSRSHGYDYHPTITSLVYVDEGKQEILIGDSHYQWLTILNKYLGMQAYFETPRYLWLQAHRSGEDMYLLSIGDLMGGYANDRLGKITYAVRQGDTYINKGIALTGLHRPAAMDFGDFDNDGVDEVVVANFGAATGSVGIYKAKENGWQYDVDPQIILASEPGAVDCKVADFNKDGLADVAVLFGGARENLSLFLNRGKGEFDRKVLFENHASFGYVRFQWVDFDADGDLDVITVNGDNLDSDPYNTLKPYHGIRLYLNDGELTFKESYFYPMYGAYGVEVDDFDLDGDLDLAAIAFNPDFNSERNESFVYLENLGELKFKAKTIESPKTDRWMTIESGDMDGDGDKDIILGGSYMPAGLNVDHIPLMEEMEKKGTPLLILENKTK